MQEEVWLKVEVVIWRRGARSERKYDEVQEGGAEGLGFDLGQALGTGEEEVGCQVQVLTRRHLL